MAAPLTNNMLSVWDVPVYAVMDEATLGTFVGHLFFEPQAGYYKPINGVVSWPGSVLRPATLADFDKYRVRPPKDFTDAGNAAVFPETIGIYKTNPRVS